MSVNVAVRTVRSGNSCGVSVRLASSVRMPVEKSLPVVGHVTTSTPVCGSFSGDGHPCKVAVLQEPGRLLHKSVAFDKALPAQLHVEQVCLKGRIGASAFARSRASAA